MSALARYTQSVDGTIPVAALLYDDEHLLASQDGVGLYDGPNKSPAHQSGAIHITSHRLFFISGAPSSSSMLAPIPEDERGASLALALEVILHTESYAGFFTSSPKITLHLRPTDHDTEVGTSSEPSIVAPTPLIGSSLTKATLAATAPMTNDTSSPVAGSSGSSDSPFESWECEICGYRNAPGRSPAARSACGLCGMPRNVSSSATPSATPRPSSSAVSPSTASKSGPLPVPVPIISTKSVSVIANHGVSHLFSKSLPSSSASTPPPIAQSMTTEDARDGERRRRKRKPSSIACTVCTFLNHPYLRECEMCGTPLPPLPSAEGSIASISESASSANGTGSLHVTSKSAPTSRPVSPALSEARTLAEVDEKERYIRLSFRKGGDKAFYAALKTALQQKEWEARDSSSWKPTGQGLQAPSGLSGISAILQNIDTTASHTERGMSDAFEDLEALMSKAQDMVRLAKGLNEQLTAASRNANTTGSGASVEPLEPEEATFVRSSLGQLGLNMKNTAVTADMSSDEKKYLEQLAIELASVLEGGNDMDIKGKEGEKQVGIMRKRGIVGLDEVWGGWNRARGVALISPEQTLKVLPFLPRHTLPPIHTRQLTSGLRVLHTPDYSTSSFSSRLLSSLLDSGPKTTTRVASDESLSVGLAEELVNEVEELGEVCREDPMTVLSGRTGGDGEEEGVREGGAEGIVVEVRWWPNAFVGYVWDGQID